MLSHTLARQISRGRGPASVCALHYLWCTEQCWPTHIFVDWLNIPNIPQSQHYCFCIPMRKSRQNSEVTCSVSSGFAIRAVTQIGLEPNCNSKVLIYYLRGPPKVVIDAFVLWVPMAMKSNLTSSQTQHSPKYALNFSTPAYLFLLVLPGKTPLFLCLSRSYCWETTSMISFKLCFFVTMPSSTLCYDYLYISPSCQLILSLRDEIIFYLYL